MGISHYQRVVVDGPWFLGLNDLWGDRSFAQFRRWRWTGGSRTTHAVRAQGAVTASHPEGEAEGYLLCNETDTTVHVLDLTTDNENSVIVQMLWLSQQY